MNPDAADSLLGGDRNCDGVAGADISAADYTFIGEAPGDRAGNSVALAGDVDGDGLADILVGAPRVDGDERNSGRAYLYLGSSLGDERRLELADADYIFVGEGLALYNGVDVASAGDVDGDGLDDILIGQQNGFDAVTEAYLILGSSLSSPVMSLADADYTFVGGAVNDATGLLVAGAGDVDGDGLDDVMVAAKWHTGTSFESGKVAVFLGASLGDQPTVSLRDADYALVGRDRQQHVGRFMAPAGDGLADLLIGGSSPAGDVDGDGLDDILVSSWRNNEAAPNAGKVYLVPGASLGSETSITLDEVGLSFLGEKESDGLGWSMASGDANGDGLDDLLLGTWSGSDADGGVSYLLFGSK